MKRKLLSVLLAAAVVCTSLSSGLVADAAPKAAGTTYYVSTIDGNDNNSGTSENEAFYSLEMINNIELQPGDQVLLENGSVFVNEALHIKGSGSEEAPILISNYGEGNLPKINTNGQGIWYQNYRAQLDSSSHKYQGYVSSAVLLYDVEYITVENLEITNNAPKIETAYNATDVMNRTGVAAVAQNIGTVNSIHLNNLYIHDVIGNVYDKHMNNGGIYFTCFTPMDSSTGIAKYDDVLIENCFVDNVNRWGIAVGYSYTHTQFTAAEISDAKIAEYGSTNVVIRNNYVKEAGGDAITLMYCDRPLVEYNVSDGAARQINTTDYSATSSGRVAAAIWPWKCKDAVFQYNEAFDTYLNQDGQAWDADSGDGTIYQYNYSHNNGGGSVMFCLGQSINNIFRYNISQNDLAGLNPCGNPDAHVYNNTFYMLEDVPFIRPNMSGGAMLVENNIIYYSGDTAYTESWYRETSDSKVDYLNNLYYNYANTPDEDTAAVIVNKGTTVLENPGSAPVAPADVTPGAITGSIVHARTEFAGYTPVKNSPAVDAGKVIANNGGQDFLGNTVAGTPDIGAIESDAVAITLSSDAYDINKTTNVISGLAENTSVADFLAAFESNAVLKVMNGNTEVTTGNVNAGMTLTVTYEDVTLTYEIVGHVASSDNELKSTIYMIEDKTIYVPALEKNPTYAAELKGEIKVAETATVEVRDAGDNVVESGNVADGMKVVIIAENGAENTYTVSVKNSYHWALDYAGPQQGNVWFGQNRLNETTYENMTYYDPTYPNWAIDTWYGPGVDLENHSVPTDEDTHGLISDNPSHSNAGTAMAFRAPKSGIVTVAVKDDEPYLRQNNNSGGSVIISFTKNGEVIEGATATLSESKVQVPIETKTVEVAKGDWIRVEAKNVDSPSRNSVHVTPIITYLDESVETECNHADTEVQNAKDATCTEEGYTGDTVCKKCGETVKKGTTIAKLAHTEVVDKAVAATCTSTGLTEGKHCSVCNTVITAQEEVPALGHDWSEWKVTKEPTEDKAGEKSRECSRCDAKEIESIPATGPSADVTAPTAPTELKATSVEKTVVKLSWKASADDKGVAGYDVYVNGEKRGTVTGTAAQISELTADTKYTFEIKAFDAAGNYSDAAVIEVTTKAETTGGGSSGGGSSSGGSSSSGSSSSSSSSATTAPATGDSAQILTWIAVAFVMAAGMAGFSVKSRRNR